MNPEDGETKPVKKFKFKPRILPPRVPKPEVKTEKVESDVDSAKAMELMRQFQERSLRHRPKVEKKVHASQIAFGIGGSSHSLKSYGVPRGANTSVTNEGSPLTGAASVRRDKVYFEPWDYYSNYPVTLPLRRPYSGDPEILNVEEFGEAAEALEYNESSTNSALELGLLDETVEPTFFFIQLPPTVPTTTDSGASNNNTATASTKPLRDANKSCKLSQLSGGFMGKMLVCKSGAVKLKLGDALYNVTPGSDCGFAQDVVAINESQKQFHVIAEVNQRAILTPDIDAIVDGMTSL